MDESVEGDEDLKKSFRPELEFFTSGRRSVVLLLLLTGVRLPDSSLSELDSMVALLAGATGDSPLLLTIGGLDVSGDVLDSKT